MINFNQIPLDIRTPGQYIEFDSTRAVQGLPVKRHRVLLIGQRSTGTDNANIPVQAPSAAAVERSYGRRSILAAMARAFKAANPNSDLWVVALPYDNAAVKATGTLTFTGPATASGTLSLMIGGVTVDVGVAAGGAASVIATAAAAAINAAPAVMVTATVAAGVVTLTARQGGETGNDLDLRFGYFALNGANLPAGVGCTVVAMSGGTLNPAIDGALANVGDDQYDTIVLGVADASNLTKIETFLTTRFGPMVQREGLAYVGFNGTLSQTTTFGNSRNCPYLVAVAGGKSPNPPWEWAAQVAALDAGESDPARPRQTLQLPTLLPPEQRQVWTREERNTLLYDGVSTYTVSPGSKCQIERLITTYKLDAYGNADTAYLNVETLRTIMYLRYSTRLRIAQRYPRHKLASDGTAYGPGQAIVTPSVIRSELLALFREWELAGLVEGFEQFKEDLIVERNASDPDRVDAVIPPDCVNQFRVFAAQVQFLV